MRDERDKRWRDIPPLEMCCTPKCEHGMPLDSVCVVCETQNRHAGCVPIAQKKDRPTVPHYQSAGIEPIDYINSHNFNFNLGNAIKYISRCGKKEGESTEKDLKKAIDYLNFEIERISNVEA